MPPTVESPTPDVRFSGAYNEAVYKEFNNAAQPVEGANQASPYRNATGMTLPGAARVTFDVDVSFRHQAFRELDFFTSFDTAFTSAYNSRMCDRAFQLCMDSRA